MKREQYRINKKPKFPKSKVRNKYYKKIMKELRKSLPSNLRV